MVTNGTGKLLIAAALTAFASRAAAQAAGETILASQVSKVVVYSDRAIVERAAAIELAAGRAQFVFDGLPERIDPNSLQVRGQGGIILEDIVFRTKYFATIPDERIKALEAQRDAGFSKIQEAADRLARSASEKAFLERIVAKVTDTNETAAAELNPDKWVQMIKFYRERLAALDPEIRAAERDRSGAQAEVDRIQKEIQALSAGRQMKKNQAVVVLSAERPVKAAIALSYAVQGPSWKPVYDLRVDSEKKTIEISYNAYIAQNTGEDWSRVRLSLSTARPEIIGDQPALQPWFISPYKPAPVQPQKAMPKLSESLRMEAPAPAQMFNAFDSDLATGGALPMETRAAEAQKGAVAVLFSINGESSIESDASKHRVAIMSKSFQVTFRYSSVPKLSPYAYLKAKVKNDSEFPFLPGASKIFLDGNFVADSNLSLVANGEEFWTFLGVDESVKVDYKLLKSYKDEQGVFEKKNRYVYQYETAVTNAKKTDVEIVLWDQLPVSTDQKLVVKLLDPKYQKDTEALKKNNQDMLEWLMTLKPGESRKLPFSYSVEYPLDMLVDGL
jgi:uncharacterized protein (TIGR02231 family)